MNEPLQEAVQELAALRGDLPQFEALVAENETAAAALKAKGAPLEKQLEAKTRVSSARELLEQHQADIQTAEGEVQRLEGEKSRQETLEAMRSHARSAQELRGRYDEEMAAARNDLEKRIVNLQALRKGISDAREGFHAAGRTLDQDAFRPMLQLENVTRERAASIQERTGPILAELERGGLDLSFVLTPYNPSREFALDDKRSPHRYSHTGLELAISEAVKQL